MGIFTIYFRKHKYNRILKKNTSYNKNTMVTCCLCPFFPNWRWLWPVLAPSVSLSKKKDMTAHSSLERWCERRKILSLKCSSRHKYKFNADTKPIDTSLFHFISFVMNAILQYYILWLISLSLGYLWLKIRILCTYGSIMIYYSNIQQCAPANDATLTIAPPVPPCDHPICWIPSNWPRITPFWRIKFKNSEIPWTILLKSSSVISLI